MDTPAMRMQPNILLFRGPRQPQWLHPGPAWLGAARPVRLLGVLLASALLLAGGCAKSSEVERVDEVNKVQEARIKALEDSLSKTLTQQQRELEALRTANNAMQGQLGLLSQQAETTQKEVAQIGEDQERIRSTGNKLNRRLEEELKRYKDARLQADSDLDKVRGELSQVQALLRSPIAKLPGNTQADKTFREAHYTMIAGELDVAADQFAAFVEQNPKDPRVVDARYRIGQANFLLRRYDRAMIAFFEVVDGAPKHTLATPGRWMLARSLEETGDLKLAREFYGQLVRGKTKYANDSTRRLDFINRIYGEAK